MAKELSAGVDPSSLDDDGGGDDLGKEGEGLRDLFWDKVVLFFASAIVALTAVDILTELLRGGNDIVCYLPAELNVSEGQEAFTNSYCAQSVPDTQYLPIFVLIHGVLIAICHYIWKSSFSDQLSLFVTLASELSRLSDETTGSYPLRNLTIVKKLESKFSTYNRRGIFTWYQLKLCAQLLVAVASLFTTAFVFTEFDVDFQCPRAGLDNTSWPFPGQQINCIFTSLRLFALVRVFDILLLVFIVLVLLWGLLWSVWRHPNELGYKNVSLFSFTTGLQGSFFVPRPMFLNPAAFFRGICSRRILQELQLRFLTPRITTDLEFLLILLFRSDSSLAHSFREGQILAHYKALVDMDRQIVLYKNYSEEDREGSSDLEKEQLDSVKIGWNIPSKIRKTFQPLPNSTKLVVPDNIRGAILGLSLRAPGNDRAINVSFGSEGFCTTLARVFDHVGLVNFDPDYQGEDDTSLEVIKYGINATGFRCYDDIFSRDTKAFLNFSGEAKILWDKAKKRDYYKISYMVLGPIAQLKHIATANTLLDRWKYRFSDGAVLVVVQPLRIEYGKGDRQFHAFTPSTKLFQCFNPNVTATTHYLNWPSISKSSPSPPASPPSSASPLAPGPQVLHLECGHTSCALRISTYKFVWDEEDSEEDSSSESPSSSEDEEAAVSSSSDVPADEAKCADLEEIGTADEQLNTGVGGVELVAKNLNTEEEEEGVVSTCVIEMSEPN